MKNQHDDLADFIELCMTTRNKKTFSELLDFFLTPEERADLAARLLIVKELLKQEKTQRQISKDTNVSIAKITRGSNELKRIDPHLLVYLKEKLVK